VEGVFVFTTECTVPAMVDTTASCLQASNDERCLLAATTSRRIQELQAEILLKDSEIQALKVAHQHARAQDSVQYQARSREERHTTDVSSHVAYQLGTCWTVTYHLLFCFTCSATSAPHRVSLTQQQSPSLPEVSSERLQVRTPAP